MRISKVWVEQGILVLRGARCDGSTRDLTCPRQEGSEKDLSLMRSDGRTPNIRSSTMSSTLVSRLRRMGL
ncbi:MAG TPA: hypothetical protein VFE96_06975, partial [Candidatus Bathyarchaeia archaeon]|nr:hypothetical protein [Candidatus Bathyarchaeia archaeon]